MATTLLPVPAEPEMRAGPLKFLSTAIFWEGCRKTILSAQGFCRARATRSSSLATQKRR
jgi:hypothetical protein